jgi:hypothetical protein
VDAYDLRGIDRDVDAIDANQHRGTAGGPDLSPDVHQAMLAVTRPVDHRIDDRHLRANLDPDAISVPCHCLAIGLTFG